MSNICICYMTVSTTDVVFVWGSDVAPYMQAIHGICSLGAVIAPFAADPFLTEPHATGSYVTVDNAKNYSKHEDDLQLESLYTIENYSETDTNNANNQHLEEFSVDVQMNIFFAYVIVTALAFVVTTMYIVSTWLYGNIYTNKSKHSQFSISTKSADKVETQHCGLPDLFQRLLFVPVVIFMVCYGMSERGFTAFLTTFLISHLNWSKSAGSNASAMFWITFTIGRLSGILIVKHVKTKTTLVLYLLCLCVGGMLFLIATFVDINALIWLSIGLVGLGMSALFALFSSWVSENICQLTSKVVSILFVSNFIGAMTFPLLQGYLMDHVSQMWFAYSQLIVFFAMAVLFFIISFTTTVLSKRYKV